MTSRSSNRISGPEWALYLVIVLCAIALLCSPSPGQSAAVANASSQRQVRWCVVPMPLAQANALPAECLVDGKFLAVKAERIGVVSQLWHVRVDVAGHGTLQLASWQPLPAGVTVPPFAVTPWVGDSPARQVAMVGIYNGNTWLRNLLLRTGNVVLQTKAAQVTEYRASAGGWHAVEWQTRWSGQDAIDVELVVIWSDPSSPAWSLPDARIAISLGDWPVVGEPLVAYAGAKNGWQQWDAARGQLYRGPMPHGVGLTFRGVIGALDDSLPLGPVVPVTLEQQAAAMLTPWRQQQLIAAGGGPLVAAATWNQEWMAFGVVPATSQRADPARVRAALAAPGGQFDQLPYANMALHGGTGMQPPFGALKDLIALQGDPWRVLDIVYRGADDYFRRSVNHRELDGRITTKLIRPGFETWAGTLEPNLSPDLFGKPRGPAPWGWDSLAPVGTTDAPPSDNPYDLKARPTQPLDFEAYHAQFATTDAGPARSVYADDQHRGDGYLDCAIALTGSRMLRELKLSLLATDECRAMPRRGWWDAPRAVGRLGESWGRGAVLFDGAVRDRFIALALAELAVCESMPEMAGNPVKFLQTIRDNRVLPGMEAGVPWNNALAVLGFLELAAACDRIGRASDAQRFRSMARTLGRSIVAHCTVTHTTSRVVLPIQGLKWLPGGALNPPSYYVFPRANATDGDAFAGIDLLVGTPGWWSWYAGSLAAAQLPPLDAVSEKAAALWAANASGGDVQWQEWFACRGLVQ